MDLNFYANEGHNLYKFAKYNIETINNRKYIVADSSTKNHSSGAPLIDLEEDFSINALVDLLNIGKSAVYEENHLEEQIINFVNTYSTLGLMNKLLIGSNWYCEPLDMFVQYVKYMYNLLNAIINKEDTVETKYNAFEVNHINMFLTQKENVNIEIPITSLKQFIDFYFARTVSRDVNLLKICKFCNKAFIANNPKAEYDTPQCKNKANVYKSRAKNK